MIVLDNVCKTYSTGVSALNGVNLRIHKGEFVFIVGSSGSGKTTLFKLLLKELEPTSGRIYINSIEGEFSEFSLLIPKIIENYD